MAYNTQNGEIILRAARCLAYEKISDFPCADPGSHPTLILL
jgi:hypothetical protein